MNGTHYVIIILAILFVFPFVFKLIAPSLSRLGFAATPLNQAWEKFLQKHLPIISKLSPSEQSRLRRRLKILIAETDLESFDGLIRSDEMRIAILSHGALMDLGRNHHYPELKALHAYPKELPDNANLETLNFLWNDEEYTSDPCQYWVKYHYQSYSGQISKEEFKQQSLDFFTSPSKLDDHQYQKMKEFYKLDSRNWFNT